MKKNITRLFFMNLIKSTNRLLLSICLLISTSIVAYENENQAAILQLGTPANFLKQVGLDTVTKNQYKSLSANSRTQTISIQKQFSLLDNLGNSVNVIAENLSVEADGTLAMNGHALGLPGSEFILQGNEESIYGWLIFKDQDLAYEYTTEHGKLIVSQIKITDIRPICNLKEHSHSASNISRKTTFNEGLSSIAPHIGGYSGSHVGQLESKPGSSYVIFLDTRNVMSDGTPYDVSKEFIWVTWQIVAASFSMFDVNVTTDLSVYNSAAPSRRGGGTMYRETGRSSCAFAFGTSTFCTLYKEADAYGQGRTAAHEFGHLLHLNHDGGSPGGEYHEGIADYQWMPIMGNYWFASSWGQALYQWSKGEYSGASNREDDFAIMQSYLPFKADDNTSSKALIVDASGNVNAENNAGQIARNTDSDSFTFTIGDSGGTANFVIDRVEHIGGAMLDVQASIKNSSGTTIAQSNKEVNRSASFAQNLTAGNYTLDISGGAEGTPNHGFSKYSSMGYYTVSGSITGGATDDNLAPVAIFTIACDQSSCDFDASDSYDLDGSITVYQWDLGDGNSLSGNKVSHNYAANGNYTVRLTVADDKNKTNSTEQVVTIDVPVEDIILTNNIAVTGLNGAAADEIFFRLTVPEQAKNLSFTSVGGSGDADLVVSFGSHPSKGAYDCRSQNSNNDELCQFSTTQSGDYYALLYGYSNFDSVSMTASYEVDSGGVDPIANFSFQVSELAVTFSDSSTDSNGSVSSWNWSFGDGNSSQQQHPSHSYATSGNYNVSLTVTDNEGRSNSHSQQLQISDGSGNGCDGVSSWDANTVYFNGDQVSYNNDIYQAGWWTKGQVPSENSGQWQVWSKEASCN